MTKLSPVTVTIDEQPFPLDLRAVTAEQIIGLRANLGVDESDLKALCDDGDELDVPIHVVVAAVVLSLKQRELPADASFIAERITLANQVRVIVHEVDDSAPVETKRLLDAIANP